MNAILLVGGFGTRLRPLTLSQPKPLLPILNKPFISYQLDLLKKGGVKTVVLAIGPHVKEWGKSIRKIAPSKMKVLFSVEKKPMGTGGAIRLAYDALPKKLDPTEPIVVFNGDVFLNLDVKGFVKDHKKNNADGSIALARVPDISRYGLVKTQNQRILKFIEKPPTKKPGYINAGAYLLNAGLIKHIPRRKTSIEREFFPDCLKRKKRLFATKLTGYWNDIGTPQTYLQAHSDLLSQNNRWTHQKLFRKRKSSGRHAKLVKGLGCKISTNAELKGFVCVGHKVEIGANCQIENTILMDYVRIEAGSSLKGVIVGKRTKIGRHVNISEGVVIGENSNLTSYTRM